MTDSMSFSRQSSKVIGLNCPGSLLGIGLISAVFQSRGYFPSLKDLLKRSVSACWAVSVSLLVMV